LDKYASRMLMMKYEYKSFDLLDEDISNRIMLNNLIKYRISLRENKNRYNRERYSN